MSPLAIGKNNSKRMKNKLWSMLVGEEKKMSEPGYTAPPTRMVHGVVAVISEPAGTPLVTAELLSRVAKMTPELSGFLCVTLVPVPVLIAEAEPHLSAAIKSIISRLFRLQKVRVAVTAGVVEIGSFGSNELLLYGGIGQPVLRAIKAMLLFDQRSSWCDKELADQLAIPYEEATPIDEGAVVRVCVPD